LQRFGRGSAQVFARENRDLASDFASLQFSKQPSENTKRREVAAHESFNLAGRTGLEPATSGVTGRGSNQTGAPEGIPRRREDRGREENQRMLLGREDLMTWITSATWLPSAPTCITVNSSPPSAVLIGRIVKFRVEEKWKGRPKRTALRSAAD